MKRDRDLLLALASEAEPITGDRDSKLRALADTLAEIARQAEREATDGIDEAQRRKVLVFSFYEDTVEWVRDFLDNELHARPELKGYRGRVATVSGSGDLDDVSRQQAVQGFAPISMEAPTGSDADLYDLLISTDVLAEGVNLQQCRHIVNFDMPWNPMRLVQRHGRIDRIGSPHNRVFLRTIFPVDRLDALLELEQRILDKLAMAAASVGVTSPIEGAAHGTQVFTETRDEIEKLLNEDSSLYERGRYRKRGPDRRGVPADLAQGATTGSQPHRTDAVEDRFRHAARRSTWSVLLRCGRRAYLLEVRSRE